MSLAHWLSDLESRHSQEIQLGLERVRTVAQQMALDSLNTLVITIAGTNGKGSTVAALERIYYEAGYRVGAYTSPHLLAFNERIRVNLIPIAETSLCEAFECIDKARGAIALTYFEMTTLAAFWYFKKQKLDIVLLEVGLGGRLDATNVINSNLAIISTIDFDHQDFLGSTLEAIAYEKAGILRPHTPFIYADWNPPQSILNVAKQLNAPGCFLGQDYFFVEKEFDWEMSALGTLPKPAIHLQAAASAIMASQCLQKKLPVSKEALIQALKKVSVTGRMQWQKGPISYLYDVSHNAQSVLLLAKNLAHWSGTGRVHAVFSALKDKDIQALILPLKDKVNFWYPALLDMPRAACENLLRTSFKSAEIFVDFCYNSPRLAFESALNRAQVGDLIVVYGSFFTVGQVMAAKPMGDFNETSNG